MANISDNALTRAHSNQATPLFHYCTPSTFHSIIENKSIWLSSLFMSNDTKEGALVPEVITRMARQDGLSKRSIALLEHELKGVAQLADGLAFCLSTKGDLLSQWRGYADDGNGFAIGFDKATLKTICDRALHDENRIVSLYEVLYEASAQEKALAKAYGELKGALEAEIGEENDHQSALERLASLANAPTSHQNSLSYFARLSANSIPLDADKPARSELSKRAARTLLSLFLLKGEAFAEENEFRVLELHFRGDPSKYRHANGKLIPYKTIDLSNALEGCITHVKLGPKNQTPIWIVKNFLSAAGFLNVDVSASAATYR